MIIGGRNGKISNLFGGLVKCGYCGKSMRFVDKGKPPKGSTYLVCDGAARGLGCKRYSWRYDEIEQLILTYCKGLELGDLIGEDSSKDSELVTLKDGLSVIIGKLKKLQERTSNLTDQIADTSNKKTRELLVKKLDEMVDEEKTLDEKKKKLNQSISRMGTVKEDTQEQIANLKELMQFMQAETGDKLIDVRKRLRNKLRGLISIIKVYPMGNMPWFKGVLNKKMRELRINFKSGSYLFLSPATDTVIIKSYEHGEGRTYYPFINLSGRWDVDIDIDETKDDEIEERSKRVADKVYRKLNKKKQKS